MESSNISIVKKKSFGRDFQNNIGQKFDDSASTYRSHSEILFDYFVKAYQESKFTDIAVRCDGKLIRNAHRIVLSAFSSNFENVLKTIENVVANLEIDSGITGVTEDDLSFIVDYMYSGKLKLFNNAINSLRVFGCDSIVQLLTDFVNEQNNDLIIEDSDHADCFLMALERFNREMLFFDCLLTFQDSSTINCHRQLLCAFSHTFEEALRNTNCYEMVTIDMNSMSTTISREDMQIIINFMYTGRVKQVLKRNEFFSLRDAAINLGVRRLINLLNCKQFSRQISTNQKLIFENYSISPPISNSSATNPFGYMEKDLNPFVQNDEDIFNDYSNVYNTFVEGPSRGKKLFNKMNSKRTARYFLKGSGNAELFINNNGYVSGAMDGQMPSSSKKYSLETTQPDDPIDIRILQPVCLGEKQKEVIEKTFQCPFCDHKRKEKSAVEKHIRCIHTHETPYKCQYCQQSFKIQSNLMRHIRTHTGQKPYVCKKCGNSYADKKNMDAHVYREHLKMSPFVCPELGCNAKFWRKDRFELHSSKFHSSKCV